VSEETMDSTDNKEASLDVSAGVTTPSKHRTILR
jgi:hypothetical protein